MKTIYIIDGSSFAYRAFYAIGQLGTHAGLPTNAVYGFTRMLKKLAEKYHPDHLAVVFDTGKPTFRHVRYKQYKAQRKPMPDEMVVQLPWIKKIVSAYRIPIIEKEGYEADDVIATLAHQAEAKGLCVYIVTGDKDMMQIVGPKTKMISPAKDDLVYDAEKIKQKFGVGPEKIIELLALTGDSSDNIPGVPGVGVKTAARLIRQFGGIKEILQNADTLTPKLKMALKEHTKQIEENLELVTLMKDVELEIKPGDCVVKEADIPGLKNLFRDLEFKNLLKELLDKDGKEDIRSGSRPDGAVLVNTDNDWVKVLKELRDVNGFSITRTGLAYEKGGGIKTAIINAGQQLKEKIAKDMAGLLTDPAKKKYASDMKKLLGQGGAFFTSSRPGGRPEPVNVFDVFIVSSLLGKRLATEENDEPEKIYNQAAELEKGLINEGLFDLYSRIESPLANVLISMEKAGIKLDRGLLQELAGEIDKELLQLTKRIHQLAGEEFNINSPQQLETILFAKLRLPAKKRTKTGYSTDVEVLKKLVKYHQLPQLMLDYRQLNKLKGTYVDPLPKLIDSATGRLHTTFNQVGTATGRISSTNPNLQNIPVKSDLGKRIRCAFVPEGPDKLFLGADYSQIELRILAHFSGTGSLIDAFHRDEDIHTQTAREIFGTSNITANLRRRAKIVNFGIIYGMGARALSVNLEIQAAAAQEIIDAYFDKYPGVAGYIEDQLQEARENGYVVTMFGRKRVIPELFSSRPQIESLGKRIAINTPIQGTAADIIKIAMVNIYRRIRRERLPAQMVLQVHDELIFEVAKDRIDEIRDVVKQEMEEVVSLKVPLKVDLKTGRNWAEL